MKYQTPDTRHQIPDTRHQVPNLGQTILEVIVALTLIILFLSGVVVIELLALRNTQYAQNKSLATVLAKQQLERARVIRDSAGITILADYCSSLCFINSQLTPLPLVTPTGVYSQRLTISQTTNCPTPALVITPTPVSYRATALVSWSKETAITPAPQVELSTCLTDWR